MEDSKEMDIPEIINCYNQDGGIMAYWRNNITTCLIKIPISTFRYNVLQKTWYPQWIFIGRTNLTSGKPAGNFCLKSNGTGAIVFPNVNVIKKKIKAWTVFPAWSYLIDWELLEILDCLCEHMVLEDKEIWSRTRCGWLKTEHMIVYVSRYTKAI